MGMSGVGKTYLSRMLKNKGWLHYSCDYEIGTTHMGDEMVKTLSAARGQAVKNEVTVNNLGMLSEYVGRLGGSDKGGLSLEEFKRRQNQYFKAECASLRQLKHIVGKARDDGFTHIVNDSTGSLCEIDDETLLETIDENSLIVYIKANEAEEQEVLKRAQHYPKPLFFSPEKFDEWLEVYLSEKGVSSVDEIIPDEFSRWVFPKLFENRLPKYQRIADKYGTTIPSDAFKNISTPEEFLDIIVKHLDDE